MKKLRILYVLHTVFMDGSSRSFLNMILQLKNSYNIEPIVVYPRFVNNPMGYETLLPTLLENNIKIERCFIERASGKKGNKKPPIYNSFIFRYIIRKISKRQIIRIAKKNKVDIIHTNSSVIYEGYYASKELRIPHVWHIREYQDLDSKIEIYPSKEKFQKMLSDKYTIVISRDIQKHFCLCDEPKSKIVYNPILSESEVTLPLYPKDNYFLIANVVTAKKKVDDAIKAFSIFSKKRHDYKLIIAGRQDPQYFDMLIKMCAELNISDKVNFVGEIKNPYDYMKKAKALLVSSSFEGFGRMTAEAIMLGCMVIGRNTGGSVEIISLTNGGYLFSDVEDFASKMMQVADMPETDYRAIMDKAQQDAINSFSCEKHAESVSMLYQKIINEQS